MRPVPPSRDDDDDDVVGGCGQVDRYRVDRETPTTHPRPSTCTHTAKPTSRPPFPAQSSVAASSSTCRLLLLSFSFIRYDEQRVLWATTGTAYYEIQALWDTNASVVRLCAFIICGVGPLWGGVEWGSRMPSHIFLMNELKIINSLPPLTAFCVISTDEGLPEWGTCCKLAGSRGR